MCQFISSSSTKYGICSFGGLRNTILLSLSFLIASLPQVVAQQAPAQEEALSAVRAHFAAEQSGISPADLDELIVTDMYTGRKSGLTYLYLQQSANGIPVRPATATVIFGKDGKLASVQSRFEQSIRKRLGPDEPAIDAIQALGKASDYLGLSLPLVSVRILETLDDAEQTTQFDPEGLALEPVRARLRWVALPKGPIRLVWEISWYEKTAAHSWVISIDAQTGEELERFDMVQYCQFGSPGEAHTHPDLSYDMRGYEQSRRMAQGAAAQGGTYRVLPMPVESPNHGDFQLVSSPEDPFASPYGWHDTDGQAGVEYTITRGNNVHAYQDASNLNQSIGDEPNGGPDLVFDFPYNQDDDPESYQDAAVTNLFFWCNLVHDVWYHYGFDEHAGNFQENNFGLGGIGGDAIQAEAQDGSGVNNANFYSEEDGSTARIQMYLWDVQDKDTVIFEILSPDSAAGGYFAIPAAFNFPVQDPVIEGSLVRALDGSAAPQEACDSILNTGELEGNIALIDRGGCAFTDKVFRAQFAGASAVIICNNEPGGPFEMEGFFTPDLMIPALMISQEDCMTLEQFLNGGMTARILHEKTKVILDGDFDSGIIAHEYGHGLSSRMTGGPASPYCLVNPEQMGEGWSDFTGLLMTMKPGDQGTDVRGIGTFAINQPITGDGIRPAPYSTDFTVNPFTYKDSNNPNISVPHGVGFIWANALWEMTWDLIEVYGFDEDIYTGEGGNNIAIQLVTEGMKLQSCNPGMIDGRDAILLADQLLYDGNNQCLIWEAFARRGLGYSASQGSAFSRFDQTEAFDLPPLCQTITSPPTAQIGPGPVENCGGFFRFTDASFNLPEEWFWDFGDGTTSEEKNPMHSYDEEGEFKVVLTVSNELGSSSDSITVTVDAPDAPWSFNQTVCEGEPALVYAEADGEINWYLDGELIFTGDSIGTDALLESVVLFAETEVKKPIQSVGPASTDIGFGGYNEVPASGTITFTVHAPLVIESFLVNAEMEGEIVIELYNSNLDFLGSGTFNVEAGESRIQIGVAIDEPGDYFVSIQDNAGLYGTSFGAEYPYVLDGVITLSGNLAGTNGYDFLYDWHVREQSCFSPLTEVTVDVVPQPQAGFTYEQLSNGLVQFTDTSLNASIWLWDFGDGQSSNEQNPLHQYADPGDYLVTLLAANVCADTAFQPIMVDPIVNVNELPALEYLDLLPNPGNGRFRLLASSQASAPCIISIANPAGQVILTREIPAAQSVDESFDLSAFPPGTYLISLIRESGMVTQKYIHLGN